MLSNIFYPVTFLISAEGQYQYTAASWTEDIMLVLTSLITIVLIFRSENIASQKVAALTFLLFPVLMYIFLGGDFYDFFMIDALNVNAEAGPEEALRNVRASVDRFVGIAEQFDDLTMLCLEYKGRAC